MVVFCCAYMVEQDGRKIMTAVLGTFSDFKLIRSRSCVQIVIEIPIEAADQALKTLGGLPQPGQERWLGVAQAPKDREKPVQPVIPKGAAKPFRELKLAAQAGIRCEDVKFQLFLIRTIIEPYPDKNDWTAADEVRKRCGVTSRAEFDTAPLAGERWRRLEDQYQSWLADQRAEEYRR